MSADRVSSQRALAEKGMTSADRRHVTRSLTRVVVHHHPDKWEQLGDTARYFKPLNVDTNADWWENRVNPEWPLHCGDSEVLAEFPLPVCTPFSSAFHFCVLHMYFKEFPRTHLFWPSYRPPKALCPSSRVSAGILAPRPVGHPIPQIAYICSEFRWIPLQAKYAWFSLKAENSF